MKSKNQKKNSEYWLYGKHTCLAAINNKNRLIRKILVVKKNQHLIPEMFAKKTEVVDSKEIINILKNNDATTQGIAVLTEPLIQPSLNELIDDKKRDQLLVILDQISDPQNIGAIFRSAAAFSADAIVSTIDNCPKEIDSLVKSTVGTFELLPFIHVVNLSQALKTLKDNGYWIIGLDGQANNSINTFTRSLHDKIALVLGSEGRGLRPLTKANCDFIFKIPMASAVESLNVSCAAGIALYQLSIKVNS